MIGVESFEQPYVIPQYWPKPRRRYFPNIYQIKMKLDAIVYKSLLLYATHHRMRVLFLTIATILVVPFALFEYLNLTQWIWIAGGDDVFMGWLVASALAVLAFEVKIWRKK